MESTKVKHDSIQTNVRIDMFPLLSYVFESRHARQFGNLLSTGFGYYSM